MPTIRQRTNEPRTVLTVSLGVANEIIALVGNDGSWNDALVRLIERAKKANV